ncbi:uncharacterized protein MEPE_00504 [Melanopsichium pennsylvanicum]|uniref:Zn(2)-C6 fungal-type domain-containing protein n=2 Tax=Melanopsichium pennsylvanicum TaxID=63383 RepID=A0AAJ4XG70_9BASI|nr:potential fungal zinc cluster transcription factor [Melanopsichium pennsylvanicum 4]SNX81799.1 uncharacterized protein MEPE_00504 [Melanopsichium pennsylvanicum]
MPRRSPNDGRAPAPYPDDAIPRQWVEPTSPTYPASNHAGPSRQPFELRNGPDYGWSARPPQSPDINVPSDGWLANGRDLARPSERFAYGRPVGSMPMSAAPFNVGPTFAVTATDSIMSSIMQVDHPRLASAEEWQRYESESTIPRNALLPSRISPSLHAAGHEPLPIRDTESVTSPPIPTRPPTLPFPTGDSDPPRARVACTFCRVRKLRCDGATPCRHCERRNIECLYAPNKTKARGSGPTSSSPGKGNLAKASSKLEQEKQQSKAYAKGGDHWRGTKRTDHSYTSHADNGHHDGGIASQKRLKISSDQPRRPPAGPASESSSESKSPSTTTPSSSMPGSDLAMIQNNDMQIPMEPHFGDQDDWWINLLGLFGKSRTNSLRVVQHLLSRFVQTNAVFFGLLHAPTLFSVISGKQGHTRADPAIYLAVLAVSACDMHQTRITDERASDMRSADQASHRLASRLSEMAANYLQTSTAHGSALTPSMGQAASILALTQPDGSTEQASLIRLAENVVRTLKLHETISSREPLLHDSEPESPLYWTRPLTSDSPEAEIKYESIVRLCWTGISHRFRNFIAKPDEDFGDVDLPEYIQEIRPMAFWQPSLLPSDLPPPFFHSQDLMRRSAHLSRLTVSLSKLEKIKEIAERDTPSAEVIEQVKTVLQSLDDLERAFLRHRPRSKAERHNVLGRTLQMFCRMHVWVRLTIWRKYKVWSSPHSVITSDSLAESTATGTERGDQQQQQRSFSQMFHPTVEFWLSILREMIDTMEKDLDAHVVDQTARLASVSDIDALARHVICACDLVSASGQTQPILTQVNRALSVLQRVLAYATLNDGQGGLKVTDQVIDKVRVAEARRATLHIAEEALQPTEEDERRSQ